MEISKNEIMELVSLKKDNPKDYEIFKDILKDIKSIDG